MQSSAPGAASGHGEAVCTSVCQPLQGPTTSLASFQPPLDRQGLRELSVQWAGSRRADAQGGAVGPLPPRRPARVLVGLREGGAHRGAQEGMSGQ